MLPLRADSNWESEIMICGGGAEQHRRSPCEATCGRIKPLSDAQWAISEMPQPRGMVEGINLLDGSILWLNGAQIGAQGFGIADNPAYDLLAYYPDNDAWHVLATSDVPRMYHSVALMLRDGRVLIAGSNPNEMPLWADEMDRSGTDLHRKYPTELQIEIYTPPYLQGDRIENRPTELELSLRTLSPGDGFSVSFKTNIEVSAVEVALYQGGFVTHALHMGQVMYFLECDWEVGNENSVEVKTSLPPVKMAPGPYFMYVMANGVPGVGEPIMVKVN